MEVHAQSDRAKTALGTTQAPVSTSLTTIGVIKADRRSALTLFVNFTKGNLTEAVVTIWSNAEDDADSAAEEYQTTIEEVFSGTGRSKVRLAEKALQQTGRQELRFTLGAGKYTVKLQGVGDNVGSSADFKYMRSWV